LIWEGKAYLPVGLRVSGAPEELDEAKKAGIDDLLVTAPLDAAAWPDLVARLEERKARYMWAIGAPAVPAPGYVIAPEGYRIPGIVAPTTLDIPLAGASAALVVLASQRDGGIVWARRRPVVDGRLQMEIDPGISLEHVAILYPLVERGDFPDAWERLDQHRDALIGALGRARLGPGCRGLLNPMGRLDRFPDAGTRFVPNSTAFRAELEAHLRRRYTTVQTATRAWSISASDLDSFAQMARLVPLWSAIRGVPRLWDPTSDELYTVDSRRSTAWDDIREVAQSALRRRYARLVTSLRQIADVPIVQDWAGWDGPYERGGAGLDGVGMRMSGNTPAGALAVAAPAASSALRARGPVWLVATRLAPVGDQAAALAETIQDAASLGARGWFVEAWDEAGRLAVAEQARTIAADPSYAEWKPKALFYPESAANPAAPMRIVGGLWWLPTPAPGIRLNYGPHYAGYRIDEPSGPRYVLWAIGADRRAKLRLSDPKAATVTSPSGFDAKPRAGRRTLDLVIPSTPIVIEGIEEPPVPEDAMLETTAAIEAALRLGDRLPTAPEERMFFRDQIAAFERAPGSSFLALRAQLERIAELLARLVWLEAENPRATNFSETLPEPGASAEQVLSLRTPLPPPAGGYSATYMGEAKVEGDHEIWVAANIPTELLPAVALQIGDQTFRANGVPVSLYGRGFGWYRFGAVSLRPGPIDLSVTVSGPADVRLDVIVLAPGAFRPDGPRMPLDLPK
jgi:hypothetical protein